MKRLIAIAALAAAISAPAAFAQAAKIAEVPPGQEGKVVVEGVTEQGQVITKAIPPGEANPRTAAQAETTTTVTTEDSKPLVSTTTTAAVDQPLTTVETAKPMASASGEQWILKPGAPKEVAIAANGEVMAKLVADVVESNKRYDTEDLAKAQLAAFDGLAAPAVVSKPAGDKDATTVLTKQPVFERKTLTAQAATEATQATANGGE